MKKFNKERLKKKIKDHEIYKKTVKNKYLVLIIILFVALVTYDYFNSGITYDLVNQDVEETSKFIDSFGESAWLFYIIGIMIEVIVIPIPSLVLNVAASTHFGPFLTTILTIIASMIGGSIAYYISRYFGHHYVDEMIGEDNKVKFHKYTEKYGHFVLFVLRINPLTSSDVFNYIAGLVGMSYWRFFISTLLGIIPTVFIISYFGSNFLDSSPIIKLLFVMISAIYLIIFIYLIFIFSKNKVKNRFKKFKKK